jgi:diaphanous 1
MPDDILIVPTVLPSGSLHFASVQQHGTVADVINALSNLDEVKSDVLGDLRPRGWAVQLIRKEAPGRQWEETELESLGDGMCLSMSVLPLIQLFRSCSRSCGRIGQGRSLNSDHILGSLT